MVFVGFLALVHNRITFAMMGYFKNLNADKLQEF